LAPPFSAVFSYPLRPAPLSPLFPYTTLFRSRTCHTGHPDIGLNRHSDGLLIGWQCFQPILKVLVTGKLCPHTIGGIRNSIVGNIHGLRLDATAELLGE